MGQFVGFVCSKCNYEKSYFLGTGFRNNKEKNYTSAIIAKL